MKTILCYGDSNTWGFMPKAEMPACDAANRFGWDVRWTGRLQQLLGSDYRVVEDGLNGRTTIFDCPLADDRNGAKTINLSMRLHTPVDLVVLMLGTNDTKTYLNAFPYMTANGVERIAGCIFSGNHGPQGQESKLLVVSPIRLHPNCAKAWLRYEFDETSLKKDAGLAKAIAEKAEKLNAYFLDAESEITADPADGIHMNEAGHAKLAEMLAAKIKEIFE